MQRTREVGMSKAAAWVGSDSGCTDRSGAWATDCSASLGSDRCQFSINAGHPQTLPALFACSCA